jgi:group II intron reverse transcriptase/maturase
MMNEQKKSDASIVAKKPVNNPKKAGAESAEPRGATKRNREVEAHTPGTVSGNSVYSSLHRVRQAARQRKQEKFTALMHHMTVELLDDAFRGLGRNAAAGVDGVTWRDYEANRIPNLEELHRRVHSGAYRAQPTRRKYIPKADGQKRPLGIAALEDKIVQRALVEILNAIYEEDFKDFSYGFRPKRGQHDALDALAYGIERRKVNWILDADIQKFFDTIHHEWLIRILEHRIGDKRVIRLIRKWIKTGYLEDGEVRPTENGTPQGAVISPLLANIYLHYAFDLWANQWQARHAQGDLVLIRYADDVVIGFEKQDDARRFQADLRNRLERFSLTLHPDKTRLIEFGRFAANNRSRRGQGKPETFNFLGFTHICGKSRKGKFLLRRQTRKERMQAKLKELKGEIRKRMHHPIPQTGKWLKQVVNGFFAYHAVPTNSRALTAFRYHLLTTWHRALKRRSQKVASCWDRMARTVASWLPLPKIRHPWPQARYAANHSR